MSDAFAPVSRILIVAMLAIATTLGAQAPDAKQCTEMLNAPTADSETVQIQIRASAFDTTRKLPPSYSSFIGEGIRQVILLPHPLALDVYLPRNKGKGAARTLNGAYRVTLTRNARLTHARTVGGTRTQAFDEAVVAALVALDTSGMLPALDSTVFGPADSLDLRIAVSLDTLSAAGSVTDRPGTTPIVRLRRPILPVRSPAAPKPGNVAPRYPIDLRQRNVQGGVVLEFVLDASGKPDMSTIQATRATATQFVDAVAAALPAMKFFPMMIGACPVASVVEMPFTFSLTR